MSTVSSPHRLSFWRMFRTWHSLRLPRNCRDSVSLKTAKQTVWKCIPMVQTPFAANSSSWRFWTWTWIWCAPGSLTLRWRLQQDLVLCLPQSKLQCNTAIQVCPSIEHLASEMEADALAALDALFKKVMVSNNVPVMLQVWRNIMNWRILKHFVGVQAHPGACAAGQKLHGASQCSRRGFTWTPGKDAWQWKQHERMNITAKQQVCTPPLWLDGWRCFWSMHRQELFFGKKELP